MKAVHIQLQPALSSELDVANVVDRLKEIADTVNALIRVSDGFDKVAYTNVEFMTIDPTELWMKRVASRHYP